MANDMMDTLKGILGENADEKIQSVISGLQGNGDSSLNNELSISSADYIAQLKSLLGQIENVNDTRSNLLLSLKPYMRNERRKSIESAVKILNLTRLAGLFK